MNIIEIIFILFLIVTFAMNFVNFILKYVPGFKIQCYLLNLIINVKFKSVFKYICEK